MNLTNKCHHCGTVVIEYDSDITKALCMSCAKSTIAAVVIDPKNGEVEEKRLPERKTPAADRRSAVAATRAKRQQNNGS